MKATITGALLLLLLSGCAGTPSSGGGGITTDTEGQVSTPIVDSGDGDGAHWKMCAQAFYDSEQRLVEATDKENQAATLLNAAQADIVNGDIASATDKDSQAETLISDANDDVSAATDALPTGQGCELG